LKTLSLPGPYFIVVGAVSTNVERLIYFAALGLLLKAARSFTPIEEIVPTTVQANDPNRFGIAASNLNQKFMQNQFTRTHL
jgi:hypothetical protein